MNWSTVATVATVPALPLPLPFATALPCLPLRRRRVRREPPGVGFEEGVLGASVSWRPAAEPPAGKDEHKSLACCSAEVGCGCRAGEPAPVTPLLLTARAGPTADGQRDEVTLVAVRWRSSGTDRGF